MVDASFIRPRRRKQFAQRTDELLFASWFIFHQWERANIYDVSLGERMAKGKHEENQCRAKSLREKTDSLRHKNQPHSIREPNKSASSAGVGMFSKDYNSTQVHSNDGKSFPGERQAC